MSNTPPVTDDATATLMRTKPVGEPHPDNTLPEPQPPQPTQLPAEPEEERLRREREERSPRR